MKFTVTSAARQLNVIAWDADSALDAAKFVLGLSHAETFYAEVTDGFTDGVQIVNAVS
jgi:hypothetical protein